MYRIEADHELTHRWTWGKLHMKMLFQNLDMSCIKKKKLSICFQDALYYALIVADKTHFYIAMVEKHKWEISPEL